MSVHLQQAEKRVEATKVLLIWGLAALKKKRKLRYISGSPQKIGAGHSERCLKKEWSSSYPLGAPALCLHVSVCACMCASIHNTALVVQPHAPLHLSKPVPWWSFKSWGAFYRGAMVSVLATLAPSLEHCFFVEIHWFDSDGFSQADSPVGHCGQTKLFLSLGSGVKTGKGCLSGSASAARASGLICLFPWPLAPYPTWLSLTTASN